MSDEFRFSRRVETVKNGTNYWSYLLRVIMGKIFVGKLLIRKIKFSKICEPQICQMRV